MQHKYTNALINESSPYLLQHAHNPVDWEPWNASALERAENEDKPILVSIGYSACHWCHVMERESFEDPQVADYMNRHFINIKIDREERPDLDHIYMDAVQAISGSGGWPLNVFLTPGKKPFYGGTYYPPKQAFNRASWMEVLQSMNDAWENRRTEVEEQADLLLDHLKKGQKLFGQASIGVKNPENGSFSKDLCIKAGDELLARADTDEGGFGKAPKFPQTHSIQYLTAYGYFFNNEKSISHAKKSLMAMLRGGIYDHLGGGLARYSTDDAWLVPHFEKMLYDNALLVSALCDTYQVTKDPELATGIHKTLNFCLNEMKHPKGGFYSAIDADSEGEEGKFYVWKKDEIDQLLGDRSGIFCRRYGVTQHGNFEGKNILHVRQSLEDFASQEEIEVEKLVELLLGCELVLLTQRNKRIRPQTDDKILLGWNALLLSAFCKSYAALGTEIYKAEAIQLASFIFSAFTKEGIVQFHSYKEGIAKHPAYLDDYACLVQGLILLQEITGDEKYLNQAADLTRFVINEFEEDDSPFFYFTNRNQKDVLVRKVEVYDSATPSGNSTMAINLAYLSLYFDEASWMKQSKRMVREMSGVVVKYPNSFANWGIMMLHFHLGIVEIAITGKGAKKLTDDLLSHYLPNRILQWSEYEKPMPLLLNKSYENQPRIYVCKNYACAAPVTNVEEAMEVIHQHRL